MRWLLLWMLLCSVPATEAHEVRPAYLEVREVKASEFAVLWKTPMQGDLRLALSPAFSGRTELLTPVMTRRTGDAAVQSWRFRALQPLRGQTLRIVGLEATMTDVLVQMAFADGTTWSKHLLPSQPTAEIPKQQSGWSVCAEYLGLGVEHILSGIDHLLFVLALLLITKGGWKLAKSITAFTVAHSMTLALATLGVVHVPQAPVEAVIALSIVFVSAETLRTRQGRQSVATRSPWLIAFAFGLLHGFGFAGALTKIGLPSGMIPQALLFFNLGVEAGQLLFIGGVVPVLYLAGHVASGMRVRIDRVASYAIGTTAMYWVIERTFAFLGS